MLNSAGDVSHRKLLDNFRTPKAWMDAFRKKFPSEKMRTPGQQYKTIIKKVANSDPAYITKHYTGPNVKFQHKSYALNRVGLKQNTRKRTHAQGVIDDIGKVAEGAAEGLVDDIKKAKGPGEPRFKKKKRHSRHARLDPGNPFKDSDPQTGNQGPARHDNITVDTNLHTGNLGSLVQQKVASNARARLATKLPDFLAMIKSGILSAGVGATVGGALGGPIGAAIGTAVGELFDAVGTANGNYARLEALINEYQPQIDNVKNGTADAAASAAAARAVYDRMKQMPELMSLNTSFSTSTWPDPPPPPPDVSGPDVSGPIHGASHDGSDGHHNPDDPSASVPGVASIDNSNEAANNALEEDDPLEDTSLVETVAKVRVNLATEAFIRMSPITGIFRVFLSTASLSFRDFLWALANKVPAANTTTAIIKP